MGYEKKITSLEFMIFMASNLKVYKQQLLIWRRLESAEYLCKQLTLYTQNVDTDLDTGRLTL